MASEEGNLTKVPSLTKMSSQQHHQPPQLRYFIARDNGNMIPLIPADELPYSVRLEGVQRVMSSIQSASGMTMVGTLPFTGRFFRLDNNITLRSATKTPPTLRTNNLSTRSNLSGAESSGSPSPSTTATTWRSRVDNVSDATQAKIDKILASEPQVASTQHSRTTSKDSSTSPKVSPDTSNKVYCAYWIRNGECDYTQQGCRYKHEMPDKAVLESIGFKSVPRWWLEKTRPVISSKEWLKSRMSDDGSACGDSESEAEEKEEHGSSAREPKAKAMAASSEEEVHATQKQTPDAPAAGSSDKENGPAQTNPKEPTLTKLETKARQLSLTGDLIDLSPISPKATLAQETTPPTKDHKSTLASSAAPPSTPISSPAKPSKSQSTSPTRKVFVPPGESQDVHIADSRKYARSQEHRHKDLQNGIKPPSPSPAQIRQQTMKSKPLLRTECPGLMASMHAPACAKIDEPKSDKLSDAKTLDRRITIAGSRKKERIQSNVCRPRRPARSARKITGPKGATTEGAGDVALSNCSLHTWQDALDK